MVQPPSASNLAEYISRPPVSLKKIHYEPFKARVHMFDALDFLAEGHAVDTTVWCSMQKHFVFLSALLPAAELHSSRIKGRWEEMDRESMGFSPLSESEEVGSTARKSAWARLLAGQTPVGRLLRSILLSARGADLRMKCSFASAKLPAVRRCRTAVLAVIQDIVEIKRILRHLVKVGRAPPGLDESSLN